MIPCPPNPIPEETGCAVIAGPRVTPEIRWYYCTFWAAGKATCRQLCLPFVPSHAELLLDLTQHTNFWTPVRPTSPAL